MRGGVCRPSALAPVPRVPDHTPVGGLGPYEFQPKRTGLGGGLRPWSPEVSKPRKCAWGKRTESDGEVSAPFWWCCWCCWCLCCPPFGGCCSLLVVLLVLVCAVGAGVCAADVACSAAGATGAACAAAPLVCAVACAIGCTHAYAAVIDARACV